MMSVTLRERIRKLIPRLGSPIDGEALGTRDAIVRVLRASGFDLHDLAAAVSLTADPQPPAAPPSPSFGDMARAARDLDGGRLTPRERAFVVDMCRRGFAWAPSERQAAWLGSIFYRLQPRAAA